MAKEERCIDGIALADLIHSALGRGGSLSLKAKGCSMSPFIKDGDILTLSPMPRREPRIGDLLACKLPRGDKLVIHRVVEVFDDQCLIRGDYCPEPDGWIRAQNILGLVSRIDRNGNRITCGFGPLNALIAKLSAGNILYPLLCFLYGKASGNPHRDLGYLSL